VAQVTVATGYDVDYHLGQVGVDYHLTAGGEPPGRWMGKGAQALGLSGAIGGTSAEGQANAEAMRGLYHYDIAPNGTPLATRQRRPRYPDKAAQLAAAQERIDAKVAALGRFATPEKVRDIEILERAKVRTATPFLDLVVSFEKSVSLLQVGFRAAAERAREAGDEAGAERYAEQAERIEAAAVETASELVEWIEQHAAYVRTGHHSATSGEWRDAAGLVAGAFAQHTNRDGEPNLHVHLEILNRAQRADGADEKWRSLDGKPVWADRLYMGAVTSRKMAAKLAALGLALVKQEDGNGFDVGGIEPGTMAAYSKRSADVEARKRELTAEYVRDHGGRAPDRTALYKLGKQATIDTREAKEHPAERTAKQEAEAARRVLAEWMRTAENESVQLLETLPATAARFAAERGPSEMPSETERARAIRVAVAEVQRQNSTFTRGKLVWELHRALGQLPAGVDQVAYLEAMADDALSGAPAPLPEDLARGLRFPVAPVGGTEIIRIAPVPDVVDVARLGLRKDGTSIYRPPGEGRYVTKPHLDSEEWLVSHATAARPQLVTEAEAEAALAGEDLDYQQRQVVIGMLTSRVMTECLVAPAGTGKTHVMAAYARAWARLTGGRVIGITLGENAARVMADEGMTETYNLAQFLGRIKGTDRTRGHVPVHANDVLVLDEASQFATADLVRLWRILEDSGARVKPVGDTEQLGPVEAGGMFRLLARRFGNWKLSEVRRFAESWEGPASLRLRDGDILALGEYARRGRIYHGPANVMREQIVDLWLTDYLRGKTSLLMAGSNEEAAALAKMARDRLAERGRIDGAAMVTLADGNQAGTDDLVRARLNTKIDAGGRTLANRDMIRITGWHRRGTVLYADAVRQEADGGWSAPFPVPASYLEESAELGYAGNVFTAQGRTVDAGYLLVSEAMTRDLAYVGATRGRERNVLFVPTTPADPAAPSRQDRDRAERDRVLAAAAHLERGDEAAALRAMEIPPEPEPSWQAAPWEAVMAGVLARDDTLGTALEQMKAAQDWTASIGHLVTLSEAFWWADVAPQIDRAITGRLTPGEGARYLADPERAALLQLIREHELGGRPVAESVGLITARSMAGAHSIAGVMHGRLEKSAAPAPGRTQTFAERVPGGAAPEIAEVHDAADARQAELGRQAAITPEEWALRAWGTPPAEPGALRDEWERRAGLVGAYREAAGITDPAQAIGPVPAGKGVLREMFTASIYALELPDERALLAAMGNGELEARLAERDRAMALAPPEVGAQLTSVERQRNVAARQIEAAAEAGNGHLAGSAGALVRFHDGQLARLRVADAARREWAEAHAPLEAEAQAAERELRHRGLAARIPVTDAEVAEASSQERDTPPMDPELWAALRAQQTAEIDAALRARREASAAAGAQRDTTPIDPEKWARWKAGQQAENEAAREARQLARAEADAEMPEPVDPARWAAARAEQTAEIAAAREAARTAGAVTGAEIPEHVDPALWEQWKAGQAAGREARQAAREEAKAAAGAPARAQVDMAWWEQARAEQAAERQAARQARHEASARACPVTDAEIEKYGGGPHPAGGPAARRAEADREAYELRPMRWQQAQAEAQATIEADAAWRPGTDSRQADADMEAEI
jgi:conjugative relaxase-like TrwC/TraI family protein